MADRRGRRGDLRPRRDGSEGAYESIDVLEEQQLRHERQVDSVDAVPTDHRSYSLTSRTSAMRLLPVAVRRLLTSGSGTFNDNRSGTAPTETYESHATPTNVVTDVDGMLPLDLEKESLHRKSVATSQGGLRGTLYTSHPRRPDMTPFSIPRVTLQETQRYTFAIILRNNQQVARLYKERLQEATNATQRANLTPADMTAHVAALQQKALRRLVQAGLGVILLDNDTYISDKDAKHGQTDNICILVDPYKSKGLLNLEFMREKDELAIHQGNATARLGEARLPISGSKDICFSPALELQLTHNIIRNAFRDYDQDVCDLDRNFVPCVLDVVHAMFPLHDKKFNNEFFNEYRRHTFKLRWGKTVTGNSERWAIEELRLHFGERVAFLFAFMHIYTKALLPLLLILVTYYMAFRFGPNTWDSYLVGLAILGFLITSVWGPILLHLWNRETLLLAEKWNLGGYKQTAFEANDENPHYEYTWEQNVLTHQYEKVPKTRKLGAMRVTMGFFVLLSCVIQCICILPFIQWYVYAKTVLSCGECKEALKAVPLNEQTIFDCKQFLTCFNSSSSLVGTDRWVYILAQGIVLGLMIDVVFFEFFRWLSIKFVHWENCAKKSQFEAKLIHRSFVFVWTNWFFWFLFLAFVYIPYGELINIYFKKICDSLNIKLKWTWDPTVLSLDQLFVTPLVATQFLNMILETWVPYVMKKYRGKPFSVRYWFNTWSCTLRREFMTHAKRATNNKSARRLSKDVTSTTRFFVPVLERSDDDNQHTAYEIVAEATLPEFDTQLDYLDAAIQFSYVVMFSVVWPLLPIPAFINNILEVRGDAFRLLFCHRRPMPRRDVSIGEWATVLQYANIIGITVVSAFIVMYHGIAYYMNECNFSFSNADMVPLFTVKTSAAVNPELCHQQLHGDRSNIMMAQVIAFIILEHLGFVLRYLVTQGNKVPTSIGNPSYLRLKQLRELTAKRSAVVEQFEYMKQLRLIFDKYDRDGIDHLYEEELAMFLAEWVGTDRSKLNASILFRYMDKTRLGKVPFSTCCLMLRHAEYDRFFSVLLGTCDSLDNFRNDGMRLSIADEGIGAHARHLSRYRSLSDATPRTASGRYCDDAGSDQASVVTTPRSLFRQRMSSSSSSSSLVLDPTGTRLYIND
ncbi:hypothetical protein H310_01710 [Aphanomyces invadans]|uniref:Anoctamin transmembrane domain-containing protein n=1 Tax=Aphanomyces invadans TaxID=157072 RepID=A0A024USK0_9STRA|nr:hypothetical protein H310_01710 [Aphanomyces invadans]ETW09334.1 hypothetical protein H310_01710 [Aphanomyces invadans]|eukprot:XP_008863139.1 hypothetical protein H310_01710 [Aphanomyces invadans]